MILPNGYEVKLPPNFFRFGLANVLTIILIAGFAISWWTNHESSANVASNTQVLTVAEHGRRLDSMDTRMNSIQTQQATNTDDLHELMTKFRIMVELVDG